MVAMVTSNLMGKYLPCQIVPRLILGKVTKFCGFSLLMKKVINVPSQRGHHRLPPLVWIGLTISPKGNESVTVTAEN